LELTNIGEQHAGSTTPESWFIIGDRKRRRRRSRFYPLSARNMPCGKLRVEAHDFEYYKFLSSQK
jgi:hypothetical protein